MIILFLLYCVAKWQRHSWATIAKHKEVPIATITKGMGHDVKTTEVYLDSFDNEVLDDYNEMIVNIE